MSIDPKDLAHMGYDGTVHPGLGYDCWVCQVDEVGLGLRENMPTKDSRDKAKDA